MLQWDAGGGRVPLQLTRPRGATAARPPERAGPLRVPGCRTAAMERVVPGRRCPEMHWKVHSRATSSVRLHGVLAYMYSCTFQRCRVSATGLDAEQRPWSMVHDRCYPQRPDWALAGTSSVRSLAPSVRMCLCTFQRWTQNGDCGHWSTVAAAQWNFHLLHQEEHTWPDIAAVPPRRAPNGGREVARGRRASEDGTGSF
jgi:hypothetical protein